MTDHNNNIATPSSTSYFMSRLGDATLTWFLTVNPAQEVVSAALQSDSLSYGMIPSPPQIIHATVGRLCSRSISCVVTAFFAPDRFPYPWSDRSQCFDSNGEPMMKTTTATASASTDESKSENNTEFTTNSSSSSSSSRSSSSFHNYRYKSTLFYFTNANLVQFMFERLFTTKVVNYVSDFLDAKLFRRIRCILRQAFLKVDQFFGVDHLPAYPYESIASDLNKQQTDYGNLSSIEKLEQLEQTEREAEKEFNKHVYETLADIASLEGPVRGVLYRNTIPMLTHFIQTQAMWLLMTGMSKVRLVRRLMVGDKGKGRFFHRSAVIPYSQLWKMHLSESIVNIAEIGMSLAGRVAGAMFGFYFMKAACYIKEDSTLTYYLTVADGALIGEQFFGHYLTKDFRSYVSYYIHHRVNSFLSEKFPLDEETIKKEMEDMSDMFGDDEEEVDDDEDKEEDEDEESAAMEGAENNNNNDDENGTHQKPKKSKKKARKSKDIGEEEFDEVSRQAIFTKENYYANLSIEKTATQEEIRKAYRREAIKCHPDRLASASPLEQQEGMKKFKTIQQSYEILSNETRRREYDFAQEAGMYESPEVAARNSAAASSGSGGVGRGGGPPPNPFAAFFGVGKSSGSSNQAGGGGPKRTRRERRTRTTVEKNAFGEEVEIEEEYFVEVEEVDDEQKTAYEQFQEYQHQPPAGALHPALIAAKYFEFVERVCGPENIKTQQAMMGVSSIGAFGMMFVVAHQQMANQYGEFLKPGI